MFERRTTATTVDEGQTAIDAPDLPVVPARLGVVLEHRLFSPMKNVEHIKVDERHDFHEDEPQLVIQVIRDMAKRARE